MPSMPVHTIITYVPVQNADAFLQAVTHKIPQLFGPYDRCAWWSAPGTGQFRPLEGAQPAIGEIDRTEQCPEIRLEFCLGEYAGAAQAFVRDVLIPAHPYEEPVVIITQALAFRA